MAADALAERGGTAEHTLPEGRYHAFADPVQDTMYKLILSLGAEVWVLKDRVTLLEEALASKGIEVSQLIEDLSRNPDRMDSVRVERAAFLSRFLRAIEIAENP